MLIRLSDSARLFHADCRDAIKSLPDNSIDSVVTDPPYGLQFMGAEWDKLWRDRTDIDKAWRDAHEGTLAARARKLPDYSTMSKGADMQANHLEWAREVFRVLKPGGHIAAFSASRTYHRMACAIEDAGFEIRDSLMWVYGTGFPKSHSVAKGIHAKLTVGSARTEDMRRIAMGDEYEPSGRGRTNYDHGCGPNMSDVLAANNAPLCAEAAAWEGWGTALKPAFEPIVLARKPLSEGTVAANVLRWGTGALNIGACRVETTDAGGRPKIISKSEKSLNTFGDGLNGSRAEGVTSEGRWPANVVHDGSDEVVGAFPNTHGAGSKCDNKWGRSANVHVYGKANEGAPTGARFGDSGSAARFFYSAKASKADRAGSKHPTIKPISLMEWLATLITPPGGTILDPFAGSGTTGAAARNKGFNVILCEREDEYVRDIKRRFGARPDPLVRLLRWNAAVASYRTRSAA